MTKCNTGKFSTHYVGLEINLQRRACRLQQEAVVEEAEHGGCGF